jgi:hypothetical protein
VEVNRISNHQLGAGAVFISGNSSSFNPTARFTTQKTKRKKNKRTPELKSNELTISASSRLGSGARGADFDASKRAASCPEFGLAALTPRLFA